MSEPEVETTHYGEYKPVSKNSTETCCITLNMSDRLRLLACPDDVVPLIRDAIIKTWLGIQKERSYFGSHEFKLKGSPWHAIGDTSVSSRRLLLAILTVMAKDGWNLIQSTGVSKKEGDKDSLFFEKCVSDPNARLFAVSLNMRNRLRVIDAPELISYVEDAIKTYWSKGVTDKTLDDDCWELKLAGNPWYPVKEDGVHSKLLLCQLLANLRQIGFKFYAAVDLSYGAEGQDLETWIFRKFWHDVEYVPAPCECCGELAHKADYTEPEDEEDDTLPSESRADDVENENGESDA